MELRELLYFITCACCGSLTTAAEELFTTQPHVSMVIRELEKKLGVPRNGWIARGRLN